MRVGLATEDRRRSRATFRTKVVGALAAMLVLPIAAGLTTAGTAAAAPAPAQAAPAVTQNPTGAAVTKVDWLSERRVALWVNSPAMGTPIQVQILLARDWNVNPSASFPSVWMLDGLRATDNENAWTYETDAESFYADKNVNVILPVGGQSSFYSDWLQPDNGKNYQWETFLTKELPPILEKDWRTTQTRGVVGLSMGGTSAMFLTARNPGFFKFAASLSGILTTTSLGMPQAIQFAMTDAGGYNSAAMWGPPSNAQWAAHDPYALAEKLKGVSLYVSSGSGTTGPYDQPSGIPGVSTNYAGMGLEILARLTSQTFATKLNQLGIPAQVNYRPSGTHSWPYWQFELHQLWPQLANAIGVEVEKPACGTSGEIGATAAANGWIGDCITPEYSVAGGLAQDFRNGRIYFTSGTGAQPVAGRIAGAYMNTGAAAGPLGFPRTPELGTPDGRGRFNHFQNGSIYWTPQTGAHPVSGDILAEWSAQGWEGGPLGYPTADEIATPGKPGKVQGFEIGAMYSSANGTHAVLGMIMGKYGELGWENGWLGFPKSNEVPIKDNGRFTEFEGGNIYWSPGTGAWSVENGPLFDGWKSVGYEGGRLGFPISDKFDIPGGVQQNFQFGYITVIGDKTEVH
ncbi:MULTISPECIES: alpha/beta hydrolase-fold protein [unclassified Rhodococcus (in: high G+C Gram-positive bacteria)]|uniref:alpha/beta hydrolase-fold protein n=1 Tax=unclassified Rhodococcus (in: high G+C Gram-positive bacteria) TaxID=192944 RepID=UPI00038F4EAB|nr:MULTISPECIES: alpha/beta hydrolase-fold protein [unclassified Rhodococcus (in: high G+C Gram-positive bacteria)]ERB55621.1 esterase [Rhodococcus sp. P27]NRH31325.1 esterase [Rhodococcus sp. MS13]OQM82511.1 Diacylglycerol acyltransferase/mycolyltransferase Ag85B [Rhodococcus sp. 66b]OXM23104.1 esterase [Rhodococcus erythropolis]